MSRNNTSANSSKSGTSNPAAKFLPALREGGWQLSAFDPDGDITKSRGAFVKTAEAINRFVEKHSGTHNIYFTLNDTRHAVKVKPLKIDIATIEYVQADLDPRPDETPKDAKARYLAAIKRDRRIPFAITDSGNGVQALYRIEPIELPAKFKTVDSKQVYADDVQAIIDDIEARIKAFTLTLGGTAGTQNIDRILRLPGTTNLPNAKKRREGRTVCKSKLIKLNPDAPTYTIDDFPLKAVPPKDANGAKGTRNRYQEIGEENTATQTGDKSRSGDAYRFCRDQVRLGHDYKTALQAMLDDDGDAGDWAREKHEQGNKRELRRTYDRAAESVLEEDSTPKLDVSGEVIRFDPWQEYNAPAFPIDVLPPDMADYSSAVAKSFGVGNAAVCMGVLLAVSTALDHRILLALQKDGGFKVRGRFWLMLFGAASSFKTPIINEVMQPIVDREREHQRRYVIEKLAFDKLSREEQTQTDPPDNPTRYIVKGVTIEKLGELASDNPHGLTMVRDELAGWIGEFERYGNTSARADTLQLFDGGYHRMERKSHRDAENIENWSACVFGGMQPARLAELLRETGLTSDGLLQRFIPILMPDVNYSDGVNVDRTKYEAALKRIMRKEFTFTTVTLKPDAQEVMNRLQRRLFDIAKASQGIISGYFSEFVQKLRGLAGSLTLILHVAHHPGEQLISIGKDIVEKVERLITDFILPHALLFYQQLGGTGLVNDTTRKLASWIITNKPESFTASDLTANVSEFRGQSLFSINRMVAPLVASDWIKPVTPGPDNRKWRVPEWVCPHFADRAVEEESRKQELAKLMNSARRPRELSPKGRG